MHKVITGVYGTNYDVFTATILDNGEESRISLHTSNVERLLYHTPRGVGDKHYIDVYYKDGSVIRCFNIDSVTFGAEVQNDEVCE